MHECLGRTRPTETGKYQHDDLYRAFPETLSLEKLTHEARPLESTVAARDKQQSSTVAGFHWLRERGKNLFKSSLTNKAAHTDS